MMQQSSGETLSAPDVQLPADAAVASLLRDQLTTALERLPQRERLLLRLRYGLEDGRYRSLEEVGVLLGICRERVRQIEAVALRRLRHPALGKALRGYL